MTFPEAEPLYSKLGKMIVEWNKIESHTRFILRLLAGGGHTSDVLTANLGTAALSEAIKTFADLENDNTLKKWLLHYAEHFSRIREYRNFYCHGISFFALTNEGECVGLGQEISAKGRLAITPGEIR